MSAVEELTIVLEHDIDEQYQYEPGEVIRGKVRVKVARPTAIRTVTLRVVGEGNVSWKDEETGGMHQAEEKYVDVSKVIMDTQHSRPRSLLPGYNDFDFQYQLPDNLPSSFIGKFGNVTYTMKASVTGVKATDTAITSEPFLVLRHSRLPPAASQTVSLSRERRLWGGCSFGKVLGRLTLESRGGVPGEDVFVHAELKNQSGRTVTAMQASLLMVSMYQAQSNSIGFSQVVSKKRDEFEVERSEGRRWNFVRLTLPPYIPETGLEHCDIIDIDYVFQFRVEISGGAELKMEAPLLIGSHLYGEEPRRKHPAFLPDINEQWTNRSQSQGFPPDGVEPQNPWGGDSRVPELQSERNVVKNPLFRQGSLMDAQGGVEKKEKKEVPEELMENTRL
ncbi:hypothetical protein ACOMHN_033450 [Nucella lapillus]